MEHRGSEGLADLLEPTPVVAKQEPDTEVTQKPLLAPNQHTQQVHSHHHTPNHPDVDTTPDEMARIRPDLTTGELKMPE